MRSEAVIEIKPGPELDQAVAKAIGWVYEERPHPGYTLEAQTLLGALLVGWWYEDKYVAYKVPSYSTDLNAAFAAAEVVGLFTDGDVYLTPDIHGEWWIGQWASGKVFGRSATPALAICAALLELKEQAT